jgi:hypothetical protein
METLVSLLKAPPPNAINAEVRDKILELIQSWATAAEGRYELGYIVQVYQTLQREGFKFPPRVTVASSMLDSSAVCRAFARHSLDQAQPLTLASPLNGSTPTSACAAGPPSQPSTGNIIAATAETASTNSARASPSHCHTSASSSPSVSVMGVIKSSPRSAPAVEAVEAVEATTALIASHLSPTSRAPRCSRALLGPWMIHSTRT